MMNRKKITPVISIVVAGCLLQAAALLRAAEPNGSTDRSSVKATGIPATNNVSLPDKHQGKMKQLAEEKMRVNKHLRDPFRTTDVMRNLAERAGGINDMPNVTVKLTPTSIPALRLRGLTDDGIQLPVALLEIKGSGVLIVRKGDFLSVQTEGQIVGLVVKDITKSGILVEVQNSGRLILVR